ncbi:TPA: hypothetical protein HA219_02500 [Candidatus Woesearchaeota archaeon]|nr:hypothetical protein [Candidatus Woesearchaeota archaeon]HIH39563.1 hypothetical protein [Candidatus Woesearchaeota archaeon]
MKTRMDFVEKWAAFVSIHSDKEWSKLQAELIDSQIDNAQQLCLTKEQVSYIKQIQKH